MASSVTRRPLPALVSLLALLLLTALVWWRVLHRGGGTPDAAASCSPPSPTATATLPAPSSVTVQVLNATTRAGIAGKARTTLIADGFNVPGAAADDSPKTKIPGVAEIRFGPTGRQGATVLHYYFPHAKMVVTTSTRRTVTVSLGSKYRSVATPSAVQRAMRAAKVAVAAPSGTAGANASPTC